MFKPWRSEKNKVKAVFKLQFQVTQISQSGWEAVMISLVPVDSGKPTVKSKKAVVVNGDCCWEKPIFETVRLSTEPKSGKICEKVYRFVISANDLPKGRVLGEAIFDFAEYTELVKSCSISLPLKAPNSNTILHVTIERVQDDVDGRCKAAEENGASQRRKTLLNQFSNEEELDTVSDMHGSFNSTNDLSVLNGRKQSGTSSSRQTSLHADSNGDLMKSRSLDAISVSESDGSDQYTPKDFGFKTDCNKDHNGFLSRLGNNNPTQKPRNDSSDSLTDYGDHWRSATEWYVTSAPDGSSDGSINSTEDVGLRERLNGPEISSEKLRSELITLARRVEVSDLELQALRKQILKERRQGDDLSKELRVVKDERDALKRKCELLKASEPNTGIERINSFPFDVEDMRPLLEEMKQELNHERNLNANLHLQLQKTQESNSELILAVKDLEELLEQKNNENKDTVRSVDGCDHLQTKDVNGFSSTYQKESVIDISETISEQEEDEELEVLAMEREEMKVDYSLEQKIVELKSEIEMYKKDRDEIEMQMEQVALDFEIVRQENHDLSSKLEQSQLREQLKMQYECSAHMSIISDLEAQVESLEDELEAQAVAFEADIASVTSAKVEQEQRAIRAEEALMKTKRNNTSTAERLQEEFKTLSVQMSTAFSANEKFAMRSLDEVRELRLQKKYLEESLDKATEELAWIKCQHKGQLHELIRQIDLKIEDENQLILKLQNKSEELENQKKSEEKTCKALLVEISTLKVAVEKLSQEKSVLSEQMQQEKDLMAEMERDRYRDKSVLEAQLASTIDEAEKSIEELKKLRQLKDEKDVIIGQLSSDIEALQAQHKDLQISICEDGLEKENLRKQISQSQCDVQKKEEAVAELEKKLKDISANLTRNMDGVSGQSLPASKDLAGLQGKIRLLEEELKLKDAMLSTNNLNYLEDKNVVEMNSLEQEGMEQKGEGNRDTASNSHNEGSLHEIALLKEKNETMEEELKEMQERYSEISLRFAEVEGERQQLVMRLRSLRNSMKS